MIDVLSLKLPSFLISNFPLKFSFICFPLFFWAFFLLLAKCIHPARTQCMRPFLHRLRTFLARFLSVPRSQIHLYLKPVLSKCIWLQLPDLCIQPTYHASPFFPQAVCINSVLHSEEKSFFLPQNYPLILRCLVLQHPY